MSSLWLEHQNLNDKYIVSLDVSHSTWLTMEATKVGHPTFLYRWLTNMLFPVVMDMLGERNEAYGRPFGSLGTPRSMVPDPANITVKNPGAITTAIVGHTGDGYIFLTGDPKVALSLLEECEISCLGLWQAMYQLGIPLLEGKLPGVRTAVTFGNVVSARPCAACEGGPGASPVPGPEDFLTLYFGLDIVLACRLLEYRGPRDRYDIIVHERAHAAMESAAAGRKAGTYHRLKPEEVSVKDFGLQRVFGKPHGEPSAEETEKAMQRICGPRAPRAPKVADSSRKDE